MILSRILRLVGKTFLIVCCVITCTVAGTAGGGSVAPDTTVATEPDVRLTFLWCVVQFVPSPQWSLMTQSDARFGLRWQITPVLYSLGINRRLNPWRWFVVEPFLRQSGSIELFASPEYLNLTELSNSRWAFRTGLRRYVPVWQHGEYLSVSLAISYTMMGSFRGVGYEGGIYLLAGIIGLQATYTPKLVDGRWTLTLRIRYF